MAVKHSWSDAWLLQSVLMAGEGGPARFEDVVAAGDEIEHAIFTLNEIRYGVARLEAAELVAYRDGSFHPTPKALRMWQPIKKKRYLLDQLDELRKKLDAIPWKPGYDPNAEDPLISPAAVSDAELDAAIRAYKIWFARQVARLEAEDSSRNRE